MSKKRESRLQRRIRKKLEEDVGGWWFKVHGGPFQEPGIPDLVGCVQGLLFGFEVKRPDDNKGASDIQWETIGDIRKAGGCSMIITSPASAVRAVKKHLEKVYGNKARARKVRLPQKRRRR